MKLSSHGLAAPAGVSPRRSVHALPPAHMLSPRITSPHSRNPASPANGAQRQAGDALQLRLPAAAAAAGAQAGASIEVEALSSVSLSHGSAADVALRFIDALNNRDLSTVVQQLSDDCLHQDLSHEGEAQGKEEVSRFYADLASSMPERVRIVVEDVTRGDDRRAAVTWHMELDGTEIPLTKGLSFYRTDGSGRICYVRQSPEHFIKVANLALTASASAQPIIDSLGPMAVPTFWSNLIRGATDVLASAPPVDQLLMQLAAAGASSQARPQQQQQPASAQAFTAMDTRNSYSALLPGSKPPPSAAGAAAGHVFRMQPSAVAVVAATASNGIAAAASAAASIASAATGVAKSHVVYAGSVVMEPPPAVLSPPAAAAVAAPPAAKSPSASPSKPAAKPSSPPAVNHVLPVMRPLIRSTPEPAARPAPSPVPAPGAISKAQVVATVAPATANTVVSDVPTSSVDVQKGSGVDLRPASGAAAARSVDGAAAVVAAAQPIDMTGVWEKDLDKSDVSGYERALDLWQISGMQKATARLIEGVELVHKPGSRFSVHFLTIIPYFKVTEDYPLAGQPSKMRRRDLRSGDAISHAKPLESGEGVAVFAKWAAPYAGELEETYACPEPGVLHVTSTIRVGANAATTLQVYNRRNLSRQELLKASEKRNGSADNVLKRMMK